mmetsp:Transcript_8160/g.30595  ORF Transcript_8160/g.30595 Transcript_8160/m.30595 type:complete len:230 (-) Transcript_8160:8604-9293(-)
MPDRKRRAPGCARWRRHRAGTSIHAGVRRAGQGRREIARRRRRANGRRVHWRRRVVRVRLRASRGCGGAYVWRDHRWWCQWTAAGAFGFRRDASHGRAREMRCGQCRRAGRYKKTRRDYLRRGAGVWFWGNRYTTRRFLFRHKRRVLRGRRGWVAAFKRRTRRGFPFPQTRGGYHNFSNGGFRGRRFCRARKRRAHVGEHGLFLRLNRGVPRRPVRVVRTSAVRSACVC